MLQVRVSYRVSASTEREVCKSRNLPMHEACSGLESLVLVPLPLSLCSQLCLLKGAFRKAGNQGRIHICWGRRPEGKAEETHTLNDGASPGTLKCQAHWRTITNSLRLEGTSEDCLVQSPCSGRTTLNRLPGPCPVRFCISPRKKTSWHLWETCSITNLHINICTILFFPDT